MNPIKTPHELLLEEIGIPHLAGGGSAGVAQLVKKAKQMLGRDLTSAEISQIESLSRPTTSSIPRNPARLAATTPYPELLVDEAGYGYRAAQGPRGLTTPEQAKGYNVDPFASTPENMTAREDAYKIGTRALKTKVGGEKFAELPTRVKVIEDRDPFLTQAMTGRPPSGTRQKPFTVNVDDLHAQQASQEAKGIYGGSTGLNPGDYPAQSITPSADYFASMAAAREEPYVWAIKRDLTEQLGRRPTEDEVNIALANMNPLNMDYTGQGATSFGLKPAMPKGRPTKEQQAEIEAWRQHGIDSGQSRSAVEATGSDLKSRYPSLQREVEWGPEPKMAAGGSVTPEQMRHLMLAYGQTPQKFAGGSKVAKAFGPASMLAFSAPSISEMAQHIKAGKPTQALSGAYDVASMFMPLKAYAPLTAATYSSELGDATLDTWNAEKAAEEKAYRDYVRATSPVFKEEKPVEYIDFLKELGHK